jgi:hypothetical protein
MKVVRACSIAWHDSDTAREPVLLAEVTIGVGVGVGTGVGVGAGVGVGLLGPMRDASCALSFWAHASITRCSTVHTGVAMSCPIAASVGGWAAVCETHSHQLLLLLHC